MEKKNFQEKEKSKDVRLNNIIQAKAVADSIRTSLGPKGMDKMIQDKKNEVLITNDGATILAKMEVVHPTAKMLVDVSKSQDIEVGDGTTSVVVIAGSLLQASQDLLNRGIHPTTISESFQKAEKMAQKFLRDMGIDVNFNDRDSLLKSSNTSLNSKVVSQHSEILSPMAVDAILKITDPEKDKTVDLNDIKIVKKLGGTLEDVELVDGIVFTQRVMRSAGGPSRVENAKIGLIQFQLSSPKTDATHEIGIKEYQAIDRFFKEERKYILQMCAKIQKTGCNVLLIQKSILRDAISDLALQILAKMKILVIKDIERSEIEFVSKTLGCLPIASIESFVPEKLGHAKLVEESSTADGKIVKITGVANPGKTVSIILRGSNNLILDEAERSLHDALCVIRSIVKERKLLPGGGAPEIEVSMKLANWAKEQSGVESVCIRAYAEALEIIPYTLAENAGLHPISIVTELRNKHLQGQTSAGINIRTGQVGDILEENVVQPLLVTSSALSLATETVVMILKIDDIIGAR
eukprot:Anaeramoba_ignava/a219525_187.p1 GENE.a219525_187~~a219525_187.p1  ORF type:complete len:523 (+),score=193.91 a219525_187:53-1621(+)